MKCAQVRERLSAYLDGECPEGEAQGVARHLEDCPGCREELEALLRLTAALAELTVPAPPHLRLSLRPRRAAWWQALSLAASLILGVAVGGGLTSRLYLPSHGPELEGAALEEVLLEATAGSLGGLELVPAEEENGNG